MKEWDIGVKGFCRALVLVFDKIKSIVMWNSRERWVAKDWR